ncbi:hypothetical protein B0H10DRAFT_1800872, partial [Mycena sp. CBHHK59/15]
RWASVYPTPHAYNQKVSQSLILVNTHLTSSHWMPIPLPSHDVTAIQLHSDSGKIHIFNI